MILRRLTTAFRKQDWFTVAVETLIVVFGVFIGLQVNNWNEARAVRAQEHSKLLLLSDEIARNDETLAYQSDYTGIVVASGRRALDYLEGGEECVEGCADLLIDFFHASQLWGTAYQTETFLEVDRAGFPTDDTVRLSVSQFYEFLAGQDPINLTPPPYREHVREYFSPDASEALWAGCYGVENQVLEILPRDCLPILETIDTRPMLAAIRADERLARELRYWIGQNIFAFQQYPGARSLAENAIAQLPASQTKAP